MANVQGKHRAEQGIQLFCARHFIFRTEHCTVLATQWHTSHRYLLDGWQVLLVACSREGKNLYNSSFPGIWEYLRSVTLPLGFLLLPVPTMLSWGHLETCSHQATSSNPEAPEHRLCCRKWTYVSLSKTSSCWVRHPHYRAHPGLVAVFSGKLCLLPAVSAPHWTPVQVKSVVERIQLPRAPGRSTPQAAWMTPTWYGLYLDESIKDAV